jgi:hypothetical protein
MNRPRDHVLHQRLCAEGDGQADHAGARQQRPHVHPQRPQDHEEGDEDDHHDPRAAQEPHDGARALLLEGDDAGRGLADGALDAPQRQLQEGEDQPPDEHRPQHAQPRGREHREVEQVAPLGADVLPHGDDQRIDLVHPLPGWGFDRDSNGTSGACPLRGHRALFA